MAKRRTEEEVVVGFFNHAVLEKAQTVFNICRGIMRTRTEQAHALPTGTAGTTKPRKPRAKKAKAAAAPGSQLSFPGTDAGSAA